MTPRDLFALVLKSIGLYLIIGAFVSIPQVVISLFAYRSGLRDSTAGEILEICFFVLFGISFYIWFLYLCLFKTDWIIDKLRLDQSFSEERFTINIHRSTVLKIVVIVTGAILIIDNLPMLTKQLYAFVPSNEIRGVFSSNNPSSGWTIYYFVKFFLGFALISANRPIVNYIERKRKGPGIKAAGTPGE